MNFAKLFDRKPLIGMVHLMPLPGSPGFDAEAGIDAVVERAAADMAALQDGGLDAIMVENFGDTPFYPECVPSETVAAMTWVIAHAARKLTVPLGVNVLRNDVASALGIAKATGARFVRVNVHIGAMVTDQGIVEGRAYETLRRRAALGAEDIAILADVAVKHSEPLGEASPVEAQAKEAAERGRADGIILTGAATGVAGSPWEIRNVKGDLRDTPVLAGSGVDAETIDEYLDVADGIIIGSALEVDGRAGSPVDPDRVKALMRAAGRRR